MKKKVPNKKHSLQAALNKTVTDTELLDIMQFGRKLHERPNTKRYTAGGGIVDTPVEAMSPPIKRKKNLKRIEAHTIEELDGAISYAVAHCCKHSLNFFAILHGVDAYMERRKRHDATRQAIGINQDSADERTARDMDTMWGENDYLVYDFKDIRSRMLGDLKPEAKIVATFCVTCNGTGWVGPHFLQSTCTVCFRCGNPDKRPKPGGP